MADAFSTAIPQLSPKGIENSFGHVGLVGSSREEGARDRARVVRPRMHSAKRSMLMGGTNKNNQKIFTAAKTKQHLEPTQFPRFVVCWETYLDSPTKFSYRYENFKKIRNLSCP
jgi:hypothetical protein